MNDHYRDTLALSVEKTSMYLVNIYKKKHQPHLCLYQNTVTHSDMDLTHTHTHTQNKL